MAIVVFLFSRHLRFLSAFLAPGGAVFDDPIEQGALEADVVTGFRQGTRDKAPSS